MIIKELEEKLTEKQIKPTAMRLLVLEYLQQQKAAVSLKEVEEHFEKADRITLYRTLKTFQEKALIHSIEDGSGATKYALCETGCECAPEDTHVHFHCTSCQQTFCLPKISIPAFTLPLKFTLEEINLTAKGVCEDCQ
jgi:Fur family transcriptional regulator, ferric uptake regulator